MHSKAEVAAKFCLIGFGLVDPFVSGASLCWRMMKPRIQLVDSFWVVLDSVFISRFLLALIIEFRVPDAAAVMFWFCVGRFPSSSGGVLG